MKYSKITEGRFISRANRFVATVEINGVPTTVHVKNTGRCRELLVPGATVYLTVSDNPARKTKHDLIAVNKNGLLINMDSQVPNDVAAEWLPESGLFSPGAMIRREVTCGKSRFDFMIREGDKTSYLEVKGVTLETDGIARFPDAPTERGAKHLRELTALAEQGFGTYVLFVIQMKGIRELRPNDAMDPAFGAALREAAAAGVVIRAVDCIVSPESLVADREVKVVL